jgi:glycosyltransferase involved in cell wall biosynthesis
MRILYLTYDGLLEPLGQSQVLQYLLQLARFHRITLLSYEKPEDLADVRSRRDIAAAILEAGIEWHPLRYHRHPTSLATSYDLAVGFVLAASLVIRRRIQIVHARSYVPAVLALALKRLFGTRFLFDMRGFWPDQRVDCGAWPVDSRLYRLAKWFERRFLTRADVVVSLTRAGVAAMREIRYLRDALPRFEVIPTCTNLKLFCPSTSVPPDQRQRNGRPFTLGYVGSLGPWYLLDAMVECFAILRTLRPDARFLIVNQRTHDYIHQRVEAAGVPEDCVEITVAGYAEVPREMRRMDAGIFLLRAFPSFKAVAPTKLGEFLACGLPCLSSAGVGDIEEILEGDSVGVVLQTYDRPAKEAAVRRLLKLAGQSDIRQRCVDTARRRLSLEHGVEAYDRLYRSLAGSGKACAPRGACSY